MRTVWGCVFLAAVLAGAQAATARPGTPNEVLAGPFEPGVDQPPRVIVAFRNTATERVRFLMEWTENGVPMPSPVGRLDCPTGSAQPFNCSRTDFGPHAIVYRSKGELHQYVLKNLEFDSEYCFRFATKDVDGETSEIWSAWACTKTPSRPERPPAPKSVQVTFIPGSSGRGTVGMATPPRALIEWSDQFQSRGVAWYRVDRWQESSRNWLTKLDNGGDTELRVKAKSGEHEVTIDLKSEVADRRAAPRFRVCAVNVSGDSCTNAVPTWALQEAIPARQTNAMRAASEATPRAPSVEPNAVATASTSRSTGGPAARVAQTAVPATQPQAAAGASAASAPNPATRQTQTAVPANTPTTPSTVVKPATKPVIAPKQTQTAVPANTVRSPIQDTARPNPAAEQAQVVDRGSRKPQGTAEKRVQDVKIPKQIEEKLRAQLRQEAGQPVKASRKVDAQIAGTATSVATVAERTAPASVSQSAISQTQTQSATLRSSVPASARAQPNQPIAGVASSTLAKVETLKIDCNANAPIVTQVDPLRPNQPFTVTGSCLGSQHGRLELIGLPSGKINVPFTAWSENKITAMLPAVSGVQDRPLTLTIIRSDGKSSRPREVAFRAEWKRVDVPAARWSPSARFKSETKDVHGANSGFHPMRVQVNPACSLEGVHAQPYAGSVTGITGWENGPPHQGDITVTWQRRCVIWDVPLDVSDVGLCSVDFVVEATAWCPVGIEP